MEGAGEATMVECLGQVTTTLASIVARLQCLEDQMAWLVGRAAARRRRLGCTTHAPPPCWTQRQEVCSLRDDLLACCDANATEVSRKLDACGASIDKAVANGEVVGAAFDGRVCRTDPTEDVVDRCAHMCKTVTVLLAELALRGGVHEAVEIDQAVFQEHMWAPGARQRTALAPRRVVRVMPPNDPTNTYDSSRDDCNIYLPFDVDEQGIIRDVATGLTFTFEKCGTHDYTLTIAPTAGMCTVDTVTLATDAGAVAVAPSTTTAHGYDLSAATTGDVVTVTTLDATAMVGSTTCTWILGSATGGGTTSSGGSGDPYVTSLLA